MNATSKRKNRPIRTTKPIRGCCLGDWLKMNSPRRVMKNSDQQSILNISPPFIRQRKLRHPQVERESNRCLKKSGDKNKAWCHWQRIIYHPVFNNIIEQKQVWHRQYGFKIISLRTIELPIGHWKIMRPTGSIRLEKIRRTFVWLKSNSNK